ncbi:amino acid adenylation domain-containing protein [Marinilabiliaceae bacterium JC017]|nr:amino acid adenylation domain-containing protein [Marinilabiliaceae bacterium JC017]
MYTLDQLLIEAARKVPHQGITHIQHGKNIQFLSYQNLLTQSQQIAYSLKKRGLKEGTSVILSIEDPQNFVILFWSCIMAGLIPAPMPCVVNARKDSVIFKRFLSAQKVLRCPVIISLNKELETYLEHLKIPYISDQLIIKSSQLLSVDYAPPVLDNTATAVIQFSSGSTGLPKGVELSHKNIIENIKIKRAWENTSPEDKLVHWLPYFHDFGLFGCHIYCVFNKIPEISISPFTYIRNPLIWLQNIDRYKATISTATPTGLEILFKRINPQINYDLDLSSLKSLILGAEMISPATCDILKNHLEKYHLNPLCVNPGYGLAEATLVVSCLHNHAFKSIKLNRKALNNNKAIPIQSTREDYCEFTCVGSPDNGIEIRIAAPDGIAESFEIGEIQLLSHCNTKGYFNNRQASEDIFQDRWLKTGDLGFLDDNGQLYITGRQKEIIIINGENHFPFDQESCILSEFGHTIDKSIFTSFIDPADHKEKALHFFTTREKLSMEESIKLSLKCNQLINQKSGFSPIYSIPILKSTIPKTSSAKTKRLELANQYLNKKFQAITEKIDNTPKTFNIMPTIKNIKSSLKEIWSDALEIPNVSQIGLHSDFFALGGDSIRAMKALAQIESTFNTKLNSRFLYDYPCLEKQYNYLNHIDANIKQPENEYEHLIRNIIAEHLGINAEELSIESPLNEKANNLKQLVALYDLLQSVFDLADKNIDLTQFNTCRELANQIRKVYVTTDNRKIFPLMNFQQTLFYHSKGFIRNEPTGLSCYIICRTTINGPFNKQAFDDAFNNTIETHPMLRSVITEESDTPLFKTLSSCPGFESGYQDISNLNPKEQELFFEINDLQDNDHRFNLGTYPLYYANLYKTGKEQFEIIIHIDHQLIDGFSFFEFIKELLFKYDLACENNLPEARSTTKLQFADYVRIENFREKTQTYQKAMDFALEVFKDVPEKISLPMKMNPSMLKEVHFTTHHTIIPNETMARISQWSANTDGISLNSVLLACYFKLMSIWSGQNDMVINMPVYNREHHFPEARNVIGSFLDIFPVRLKAEIGKPILQMARDIENFVRTLLSYPVSSIDLTRRIAIQEGMTRGSLSSIIFSNSINMIPEGMNKISKYIELEAPKVQTGAPGTYIDLVMFTWEKQWIFDWNYVRNLFDAEFIKTLSEQFTSMLTQLAQASYNEDGMESFTGTNVMPQKFKQLFEDLNQTQHEYPQITINQWIKNIALQYPKRKALQFADHSINYDTFYQRSNQLAHLLRKLGVKPNQRVALLMNRSMDLPIAQLAIIIAGGAYVPIDPKYPAERIKYMLEDCGADILISEDKHVDLIQKIDIKSINHCILTNGTRTNELEQFTTYSKKDIDSSPVTSLEFTNTPEDLIYLIYTSGSTGQPKGTMLRHRNASNFLYYVGQTFGVTKEDRFAFITSYSFDMTVTSNWLPFLTGASLHILGEEDTVNIEELLKFISKHQISFLNITPSHFSMLANTLEFMDESLSMKDHMTVMLGAEIINTADINKWLLTYPTHRFINEYGPTEATVASSFFPIPVNDHKVCELDVVPIGKAIYNTQLYILNENNEHCMPGVPGILHIGGAGVAKGYLNKEEKTKSVFIPNPLTKDSQDILYNTGDLAKFADSGDIIFLGRKDYQVNVRGYRIELGEIENALSKVKEIGKCCADVQKDCNGQATVVVFYTSSTGAALENKYIKNCIEGYLPEYMIPKVMHFMDNIPITPNGKMDKKALPQIAKNKQVELPEDFIAPTSKTEKKLALKWQKVLGLPHISVNDNFWEIGGDSIKSVRLVQELKAAGFDTIKLRDIFSSPSIKSMSQSLGNCSSSHNLMTLKSSDNAAINLICLPYAAGTPGMYSAFSQCTSSEINVLAAQYPGHGDDRPLHTTIEATSQPLFKEIEKIKDQPIFILGYSYGGYVAYDLCRQLEQAGIIPRGIILVGTTPPHVKDALMDLFNSNPSSNILENDSNNLLNTTFLNTLNSDERASYINQLEADTKAMVTYQFDPKKLSTKALLITGKEEETLIRDNQGIWKNYFSSITIKELPGNHLLIKEHYEHLATTINQFINEKLIYNPIVKS